MAVKVSNSAEALLIKARSELIAKQPFFGTLALRLKLVRVDDPQVVDTAAVDGRNFFYHPPFIEKLTKMECVGLVAHEVLHCVFGHMQRRNGRQPRRWNVAADYAINTHLLEENFILPQGGLIDKEGKYKDWPAEAIYNDLPEDPEPPPWGLVFDPAGGQDTAIETEWEIATRVAAHVAKQAGLMPGGLEKVLGELFEPVVDWKSVLWPFVSNITDTDYSWSRPNRAYISEDLYMPSMRDETLGALAFCIDTSGSHSDKAVTQCWSEIISVARNQKPSKLYVIQCDAEVQSCEEIDYENVDSFQPTVKGRGGTVFGPAFAHIAEHCKDVEAIIFLSDMEVGFSDIVPPDVPTLWISTEKEWAQPPFGDVIYMPVEIE